MRTAMHTTLEPKRVRDLLTLLNDLTDLHMQLAQLLDDKLAAVKRAKVEAMAAVSEKQFAIIKRINEREGLRKQWLENNAASIGLQPKAARLLKAAQLATFLNRDQQPLFLQATEKLRKSVELVRDRNEMVARISRGVLSHLSWVLSSVGPKASAPSTYSAKGINQSSPGAMLLEAVG